MQLLTVTPDCVDLYCEVIVSVHCCRFIMSQLNELTWFGVIQWSSVESAVEQGGVTRASVCVCLGGCPMESQRAREKKKARWHRSVQRAHIQSRGSVREMIRADAGVLTAWRRIGRASAEGGEPVETLQPRRTEERSGGEREAERRGIMRGPALRLLGLVWHLSALLRTAHTYKLHQKQGKTITKYTTNQDRHASVWSTA